MSHKNKPKTSEPVTSRQRQAAKSDRSPLGRADAFLSGHRLAVILAIVAISTVLRVGYFIQLNRGPCVWLHRWEQSDMSFFDSWARQIAAGDWLCERVDSPIHSWHKMMARKYYERNPDRLAAVEAKGADPVRALWDRWAGGKRYYQGPLYPYLLAVSYRLNADHRWVFAWQMLAGIATNVLIYLIARRLFGDAVAVLAGLMACLCATLMHAELILLRETLVVLFAVAMVYLADLAGERRKFRWWLAAGAVMGVSLLLKAHFALFIMGTAAMLVVAYRRDRKALTRSAAGLGVGLVIGLAPLVARNVAVGLPPLTTASSAKPAFALWNAYQPNTGPLNWRLSAASRVMEQTDGRDGVLLPSLRTHPSLFSYLRMLASKFDAAWHWHERPDSANFHYLRLHSSVLAWMPVTFFALAPLSMVGLVLARKRIIRGRHLYLQVMTNFIVLVLFMPVGRFRLPLIAALMPFAAFTIVCTVKWLIAGNYLHAGATALAVAILLLWTGRALPAGTPMIREADYLSPYRVYYRPRVLEASEAGQWRRAADILGESLRYAPPSMAHLDSDNPAALGEETKMAEYYSQLHDYYAHVLVEAGLREQAPAQRRRAAALRQAIGKPAKGP